MAWRGLDRMAYMIKKLADFFRFTNWDYHNKKTTAGNSCSFLFECSAVSPA